MPFYMVFGSSQAQELDRSREARGDETLTWWPNPVGVFQADNTDDACMQAARKSRRMAMFFAVEGIPWGVEMSAQQVGYELGSPEAKEAAIRARIEANEKRIAELTRTGDTPQQEA